MTKTIGKVIAAAALAALTVTSAQAACWTPVSVTAAKVRDFEAMLRAASARCSAEMPAIKAGYDSFVTISRPAFAEANATIRAHFAADDGLVGSFSAYNGFLASITKSYAAGANGLACDDFAQLVDAANADGASAATLAQLANAVGASPTLVGQRCSNRVSLPRTNALQQIAINK